MIGRLAALIVASAIALPLDSCVTTGAPPPPLQAQPGWDVQTSGPAVPAGSFRDRSLWNDPSVVKQDGRYVMYMTTSVNEPFQPPILPFRAESRDGKNWSMPKAEPLIEAAGGPYVSVETPSVVRFAGEWHMFFTGIYGNPSPTPMAVGHAVSRDGKNWKIRDWTIIKATGAAKGWNTYLVGEPGAVVVGNKLHVYFSAVGPREGGGPPLQSIGLITSRDGKNFSSMQRVFGQGPGYPASQGFAGYSSPAALVRNGKVEVYYSVAHEQKGANPEWRQVAVHRSVSRNGVDGWVEDELPVLTTDLASWTSGEVLAPALLLDGGRVHLWFGAHVKNDELGPLIRRGIKGPEFGIGYASIPDSRLR